MFNEALVLGGGEVGLERDQDEGQGVEVVAAVHVGKLLRGKGGLGGRI